MESKHERKVAERKGHEKKVEAGKAAHRGGHKAPEAHKGGRKEMSVKDGRKAFQEARGHPSRERKVPDAKEAPTVPKEERKARGRAAAKGNPAAQRTEVIHRHYHYKAGEKREK